MVAIKFFNTSKIILLFTLGVIVFSALMPLSVFADSIDEQFYSSNDILFYNPNDTCGSSVGTLTGSDNMTKIWNWFLTKGMSKNGAAGILGNMQTESGFNPFRFQGGMKDTDIFNYNSGNAWGLAQWDGSRKQTLLNALLRDKPDYSKYLSLTYGAGAGDFSNAPADVNDYLIQYELEFLYTEASPGGNRSTVWGDLKNSSSAGDAADLFNSDFEGSSDTSTGRRTQAETILTQLSGGSAASSSSSSTSSSAGCDTTAQPAGLVVYYSQHDPKWAQTAYSGGTIDEDGCGPTSMAMILASLVDKTITPPDVVAVAGQQSGGTSSYANLINGVNQKWGLSIQSKLVSMDEAINFVQSGKGYVWMGGSGDTVATPFTPGGHMVAMVGVKDNGNTITIADPHNPPHEQIKDWPRSVIEASSGSRIEVPKK